MQQTASIHRYVVDDEKSTVLPADYELRKRDILCGRGRTWLHEGNQIFYQVVKNQLPKYLRATKNTDKSLIVSTVVNSFREEGILFVKFNHSSKRWYDIGNRQVRDKTAHAFRDKYAAMMKKQKKQQQQRKSDEVLLSYLLLKKASATSTGPVFPLATPYSQIPTLPTRSLEMDTRTDPLHRLQSTLALQSLKLKFGYNKFLR